MGSLRIGTRASELARWQAEHVRAALEAQGVAVEMVYITSEGDRVLDKPLPIIGGKGVFTKALDDALLANEIDLAVHSFKDVPTAVPPGLLLAAVLEREDTRDALVLPTNRPIPTGEEPSYTLATGSLRRRAQWLHHHPTHQVQDLRGNVQTRMQKLEDTSTWHGIILAAAGLHRLGLQGRIFTYLDWMLHAPAQGAIAIMCREDAPDVQAVLPPLHHTPTALACTAERTVLAQLGGGCSAPLGTRATWAQPGNMHLEACLHSLDGRTEIRAAATGPAATEAEASAIGQEVVRSLMAQGAAPLLEEVKLAGPKLY